MRQHQVDEGKMRRGEKSDGPGPIGSDFKTTKASCLSSAQQLQGVNFRRDFRSLHVLFVAWEAQPAMVWLSLVSPCRRYRLVFQLTRPQHILCLKTDAELTSCLSPSRRLWPTFNGKSQRFVVGYWKLSLWLRCVIVDNSCSCSFLSLSVCVALTLSLFFLTPLKGGVSDSTHWCIFRHRRQGECELSFL